MKNKFTHILAGLLLMSAISFPVSSSAQSTGSVPAGIVLDKTVAADPSNPYKYNLSLESYVTGHTTTQFLFEPSDIILILDMSGSMGNNPFEGSDNRLAALKKAVNTFITNIGESAAKYSVNQKIGIITFSNEATKKSDLIDISNSSNVSILKNIVNGLESGGATYSHYAFNMASEMMNSREEKTYVDANGREKPRKQKVIFFTDGVPGHNDAPDNNNFGDPYEYVSLTANATIYYSNELKKNGAEVYSIGIHEFCDPESSYAFSWVGYKSWNNRREPVYATKKQGMNAYMHFVSNNYNYKDTGLSLVLDAYQGDDQYSSNMSYLRWRCTKDNDGYYFSCQSTDELIKAFSKIGEAVSGGADYEGLTAATSKVVDKIADGFVLPAGTTAANIGLYVAKCNSLSGTEGNYSYGFTDPVVATSVFPDVNAVVSGKNITVDGFDFSDNFVGYDKNISTNPATITPHGYKLIITIPIEIDPSGNPGGASVNTNAPGSGIYKDNTVIGDFNSPSVCIPNILIVKRGLHKGESAIFKVTSNTGSTPFTVKVTCTEEGNEAIGFIKIQKAGRWTVEETGWSWAHDVNVPDNFYTKDDSSAPTQINGALISRNVNEITEETYGSEKGTLFVFNDPDKTTTPAHGEAVTSNYFNSAKGSVSVATE